MQISGKIWYVVNKAAIIFGYSLFSLVVIGFLYFALIPVCHESYPKIVLGLMLDATEAYPIFGMGMIGLILAFVKVNIILFRNDSLQNLGLTAGVYILLLLFVLAPVFFGLGCFYA